MTESVQNGQAVQAPEPQDAEAPSPKFVHFPLEEFVGAGLLMLVNERVLWPLGLALTVNVNPASRQVTGLHVREWQYHDGHHEIIETGHDEVFRQRRAAVLEWVHQRIQSLPEDERAGAIALFEDEVVGR